MHKNCCLSKNAVRFCPGRKQKIDLGGGLCVRVNVYRPTVNSTCSPVCTRWQNSIIRSTGTGKVIIKAASIVIVFSSDDIISTNNWANTSIRLEILLEILLLSINNDNFGDHAVSEHSAF